MNHSLEVYAGNELVFFSDGSWIYPLFELESFLAETAHRPANLLVADKIVGKAAAMILVHLGIGQVQAVMMSQLAKSYLEARQLPFSYQELVPRILCRTEQMLAEVDDPEQAHRMLRERAG